IVDDIDNAHVKELPLVDTDDVSVMLDQFDQFRRRVDGHRTVGLSRVRCDLSTRIPLIDNGLKHLYLLPCDSCAVKPPDQLFALTGKHRTDDHLDPSGS